MNNACSPERTFMVRTALLNPSPFAAATGLIGLSKRIMLRDKTGSRLLYQDR
jgi:hypothetical protein